MVDRFALDREVNLLREGSGAYPEEMLLTESRYEKDLEELRRLVDDLKAEGVIVG